MFDSFRAGELTRPSLAVCEAFCEAVGSCSKAFVLGAGWPDRCGIATSLSTVVDDVYGVDLRGSGHWRGGRLWNWYPRVSFDVRELQEGELEALLSGVDVVVCLLPLARDRRLRDWWAWVCRHRLLGGRRVVGYSLVGCVSSARASSGEGWARDRVVWSSLPPAVLWTVAERPPERPELRLVGTHLGVAAS